MNYQTNRNNTIRKYITGIYHLNWIKLDGNSNIEHSKKVCEICLKLKEKGLDFLTRPQIINPPFIFEFYYPDILTFIKQPFQPVIIEVTDSESKEHAESKNYPKEFKVIPFDVKDSVNNLEGML